MSFCPKESRNLAMLTDFYEITMANGYFESGIGDQIAVFDMFFRKIPDQGGFAIFAGLEQLIEFLTSLRFVPEDLEYLRETKLFSEEFLRYLETFQFSCDVWSVSEGTPIFPNEPVIVVRGPLIQTQFIETMLLTTVNHQSLIATKASRMVRAANGKSVLEFGARRAQGYDGAMYGSRAAYIGGCTGTSCVISASRFGIPVSGTMAHSWVQSFDSEYDAFRRYAEIYPQECVLLIDTYNVLKQGVLNAIRVFDEILLPQGIRPKGVRIDSGDIAYLSKKVRRILDDAGYSDVPIIASNSLDEYIIRDLLLQDAAVDVFAVGENLITSKSSPVFGGVYKLVAVQRNGLLQPRIKKSETVEKVNWPHFKKLYRFYQRETGRSVADLVTLYDEQIASFEGYEIFDPNAIWKTKVLTGITAKELLQPVFLKGRLVYPSISTTEIRTSSIQQIDSLWDEVKRFENPHRYYVDFSKKLWEMRNQMLRGL